MIYSIQINTNINVLK